MDPLSALSIAAAVVQFVDFAIKGCRTVKQLYEKRDESLVGIPAFMAASKDFIAYSELFGTRERFTGKPGDPGVEAEAAIDALVDQCITISGELGAIFEKLEMTRRRRTLTGDILGLMKTLWKHEDVVRRIGDLEKLQSQLVIRMLFYLNVKSDAAQKDQRERFDNIESKIVEVITVSEDRLKLLQGQNASLRQRLDENGVRDSLAHDRTLAAILTLQNGETRLLTDVGDSLRGISRGSQKLMSLRSEASQSTTTATVQNFGPIQEEVLRCLYFRHLADRFDGLQDAHSKTYSWVYHEPPDEDLPWDPFVQWLESGSGCYWVNGKAGSGKSTLMKYICQSPMTQDALTLWAKSESCELARASFFIWSVGSPLQRSQEGLLRSLLYEILRDRPQLISVTMPELWVAASSLTDNRMLDPPSLAELLRWFRRLIDCTESQLRLFCVIDGVDEYTGDYFDIIDFITSFSSSINVKFLVSSRPIPICVDSFAEYPSLRLQDLTKSDITQYAEDHLAERLQRRYKGGWDGVIEQIVLKSSGVFLWVVLVVRSILTGIHNYDRLEELHDRLDELPSDLKALYKHMLHNMTESYREQASRLFQVALYGFEVQASKQRLTPLQLYFAEYDDEATLAAPVNLLSLEEFDTRCEIIEGRIRSRCCGLLETRVFTKHDLPSSAHKTYVDFIHRTVIEFFRLPEVWDDIQALTASTSFSPATNLFRSCVLLCKVQPTESHISLEDSVMWSYMDLAVQYATLAEDTNNPVTNSILADLDRTIMHHWNHARSYSFGSTSTDTSGHWTQGFLLIPETGSSTSGVALTNPTEPLSFHSLAVRYCLSTFVRDEPASSELKPDQPISQATALLVDAVRYLLQARPWALEQHDSMTARCGTICTILLRQGADPNGSIASHSSCAWDLILQHAVKCAHGRVSFQRHLDQPGIPAIFCKLLEAFITHGADMNTTVLWEKRRRPSSDDMVNVRYSALKVIDALFSCDNIDTGPGFLSAPGSADSKSRLERLRRRFTDLMVARGGVSREWEDENLSIPRTAGITPNRHSRNTSLLTADTLSKSSSRSVSPAARSNRPSIKGLGDRFKSWLTGADK